MTALVRQHVPGFVGEKLTEARLARGLNQTNLADMVDISRQQISKYENQNQSPSPAVFEHLCGVLRVPPEYLLHRRKRTVDTISPVFYRSYSSRLKKQMLSAEAKFIWLQDIYTYLWRFLEFPEVNLPDWEPPSEPKYITDEFIEESAMKLRAFWGLNDGPIDNLSRLVENNGIVLGAYELEGDKLDAFSQFSYNRPHIIFGTNRGAAVRIRANIAHELGHLTLHRNIPKACLESKNDFKLLEKQANRFAGAFLFPESAFLQEVVRPDLSIFKLLKYRWKVSIQMMIKRSANLQLLDKESERSLNISVARRGWKKKEPLDDEIMIDSPKLQIGRAHV